MTSVTRSSTVTCSRPFSLITSGQKQVKMFGLETQFHRRTATHARPSGKTATFAVCFQLILPPTLHQLRPEQFFQTVAIELVSSVETLILTFTKPRKSHLPLPLPHFYQLLVYRGPQLHVFAHDLKLSTKSCKVGLPS